MKACFRPQEIYNILIMSHTQAIHGVREPHPVIFSLDRVGYSKESSFAFVDQKNVKYNPL